MAQQCTKEAEEELVCWKKTTEGEENCTDLMMAS
jgi:hypothetical protein